MLFQLGAGLFIKNVLSAWILMVVLRKIHLKKNQSASSDATNIFIDYLWLTMTFSVFGKTIAHQIKLFSDKLKLSKTGQIAKKFPYIKQKTLLIHNSHLHSEIIFRCLNFGAKNAALTKKRYARVYSIHEAIKVKISGILCSETNFIWMRKNILMIIMI